MAPPRRPFRLVGRIQPYAWGTRTGIARLQGRPASRGPQAELWLGAHPRAPATAVLPDGSLPLDQAIERWPEALLGGQGPLPFLLKVLSVGAPLSVQAHPDPAQAAAGFAREDASGIPRDAPQRNYRDPFAKPELVCALTRFSALCGFRPWDEARALLRAVDLPWTSHEQAVHALLRPSGQAEAIRDAIDLAPDALPGMFRWMEPLVRHHPGDAGALFPLLLRPVELAPGEALFLPAGQLHCYVDGLAVEVMGNSDNVLRGGLTVKHKDPDELMAVLDRNAPPSPVLHADADGCYPAATEAFALRRIAGHGRVRGPAVVLVTEGGLHVGEVAVPRGEAAFVPHAAGEVVVAGEGLAFVATPG
ncbi:MAG: mannose-6-phosphate isomerase, class I [Alphaproteobacteria bacterium]|nr:mannose-6-phosphate isomerase, class I [Alphaproteobacteria bacterium]